MQMRSIDIPLEMEKSERHCMFEYVYFAQPVSNIDNRLVYDVRVKLGKSLGKLIANDSHEWEMVVPVPDTSRIAAQQIAETLNIPFCEAFIKNRYMHRTYIMQSPGIRSTFANQKYLYLNSHIKGKKVLIVDDSIVRGLTSILIVEHLFGIGAFEVGFAVTCPPILYPCYYGVDFSTTGELIAHNRTIEDIRVWLGASKLYYQKLEDLRVSIGLPLCDACLTGDYPTQYGKKLSEMAHTGAVDDQKRHYEQLPTHLKDQLVGKAVRSKDLWKILK